MALAIPKGHKYELLAEAARLGHTIRFTVLYAARNSAATPELEEEIGTKEGELIRQRRPPLNYQIPKAENWRKFTINPTARTITLPALLEQLERDSS